MAAGLRTRRSTRLLPVSAPRTASGAGPRELGNLGWEGRWQLPAASGGEVLVSFHGETRLGLGAGST